MNALFEIAVANAVIASILAVAVWLITRVVRHPAIVQLLWVLVLAKLVTPPLVAVPWLTPTPHSHAESSHLPERTMAEAPILEISTATPPPTHALEHDEAVPLTPESIAITLAEAGSPRLTAADAPLPPRSPDFEAAQEELLELRDERKPDRRLAPTPFTAIPWTRIAITLWIAGGILYIILAAARVVRFQRALRTTRPASDELRDTADSVAKRLAYTRPFELRITPARITPLVWPVGRPKLLLSQSLVELLSPDELTTLLAHELAHLRRRDHWVRWLELGATAVYWWHPVVWFARREIARAEERACDAWVVGTFPYRSRDYASALFKTAEFISAPAETAPLLASGLASGGDLKERIEHVMNATWKPTISLRMRCTLLVAALAVLPLSLRAVAEEETTIEADPPATSTHEEPDAAISDTANEDEKTIEPGMALIVEIVGKAREGESWDDLRGREVVREDGSIGLGPMAGRIKVAGKTLQQAAEAILPHVQAIQQRPAKIQVSFATTENIAEPDSNAPLQPPIQNPFMEQRSAREQKLERSLTTPMKVEFIDTRLEEVLAYLAEEAGIDIYLDPVAMTQEGIGFDEPITINLKHEVSLKSALNLILDPLHLTFVIEDEVLKITGRNPLARTVKSPTDAQQLTHGIQPGDVVHVWVHGAPNDTPIKDDFVVEPAGTVALGPTYGRVKIAGLDFKTAEHALTEHLSKELVDPKVQVTRSRSSILPDTAQNYVVSKPQSFTPKTGEELEILRNHVAFLEQQFRQTEARYRVGAPLGSADAYELAAQELAAAQAELALAEGRQKDAVGKMKESIEHGELALKSVEASFAAGRLPQDLLLRTAKNLADSKRALLHLQDPDSQRSDSTRKTGSAGPSSSASLPSASAGQLPANLGRSDSLSVLKAIAERAKSDYERAQKLAEKQAITQSELANKKADYDVSFARIRQAEQVLRQRQVELQLAELEYKALTEAQAKAPGSVPSLELEKQKLKVEFAKAKVAEIAE